MAKKPPPGRCVYCLIHHDILTWDHVFPESWYPNTTPENTEKWQVPACVGCNNKFSRIEEDLRWRLAFCVDPKSAAAAGIHDAVYRSIDPNAATTEREKAIRTAKRQQISKEMKHVQNVPPYGVYPGLGPKSDTSYPEGYITIPIPPELIRDFSAKVVRGLCYLQDGLFIDGAWQFEVIVAEEPDAQHVLEPLRLYGKEFACGPGILVWRAMDHDSAAFRVTIWGHVKSYATLIKNVGSDA